MAELQRLRSDHEAAVLAFERESRAYFAAWVSDRGDSFFEHFADRHREMLADQDAGGGAFHVLVDEDGSVLGRFNLYYLDPGEADVGYRVAERAAGRGVATDGVRQLLALASDDYGLTTLRAKVSDVNVASQRVLEKIGFTRTGPATVGGKPGAAYVLALTG